MEAYASFVVDLVRGQVDDLPMVNRRMGFLLALQHPQAPVEALLLQCFELGGEIRERI